MENTNFQPMPKRFMVWDKNNSQFLTVRDAYPLCQLSEGESTDFTLQDLVALFREVLYLDCSDDYVACQSTNLFDKYGKEIFEGSIIKIPDNWDEYGMAAGEKYEVYFKAGGFRLKPHADYAVERGDRGYWLDDATDFELLGHILSEPELVESRDV